MEPEYLTDTEEHNHEMRKKVVLEVAPNLPVSAFEGEMDTILLLRLLLQCGDVVGCW